ncbi:hypothetical protein [Flagellimonas lutimaris]|uniref:hypothetical protein n=1 Tax=Flagellimonas lutimaris TaxID=475082 RepID=UPI003F5CDB1A
MNTLKIDNVSLVYSKGYKALTALNLEINNGIFDHKILITSKQKDCINPYKIWIKISTYQYGELLKKFRIYSISNPKNILKNES